jgi:DNA-binding winged helix-turn-helix (wHTH) protein
MEQSVHRVLKFDRFALDLTRGCVRTADKDILLRPKAFEVLCYLAENAGRLISRRELHEAVWPKVAVTDNSLEQCVWELREKLEDDDHHLIRTVPRRGYRFDAHVAASLRDLSDPVLRTNDGPAHPVLAAFPTPRLSIVVLPFRNLSGDPGQEYFSDSITGGPHNRFVLHAGDLCHRSRHSTRLQG